MELKDLLGSAYHENMTIEDINAALAEISLPEDNSSEIERLKTALSKSNSEAANYKKQLREKLSEDEIKNQENENKHNELQTKYDELVKKVNISENKARFIGLGYDEKLAQETAEALVDGDMTKVFNNQKKHQVAIEKSIRENLLNETPQPGGGTGTKSLTKEEIMNIADPTERQNAIVENFELFEKE